MVLTLSKGSPSNTSPEACARRCSAAIVSVSLVASSCASSSTVYWLILMLSLSPARGAQNQGVVRNCLRPVDGDYPFPVLDTTSFTFGAIGERLTVLVLDDNRIFEVHSRRVAAVGSKDRVHRFPV